MPTTGGNSKNILLNPAGGKLSVDSISINDGEMFTLPTPERRGYIFCGWYTRVTDGEKINDGDARALEFDELYARWIPESTKKDEKRKRTSMLKKQRRAVIIMLVSVVLLGILLGFVNYIVDIYKFEDINGDIYYIKKADGIYGLYNKDGTKCDRNTDGYYLTKIGTQLKINEESGEIEDSIYVDDIKYMHKDEIRGSSGRLLMFKQMTYDDTSTNDQSTIIKSLEIFNEYGGYTFVRNENMDFIIKDREDLLYNIETFAMLCSTCGYTLSMDTLKNPKTLADGSVDLAEYGLVSEVREREETNDAGESVTVQYDYTPASFKITAMTGEYHTVIIGDKIVSGAGYYVKYAGGQVLDENGNMVAVEPRDRIYILGASGIESIILRPVEALVTPMIVYPMGQSSYFDVKNFIICTDIDYDAIESEFRALYEDDVVGMTPEEILEYIGGNEELKQKYAEIFNKHSKQVCNFSYQDIDERKNSMYTTIPYVSHIEYTQGYYINSFNIDDMLYKLAAMEFIETVKLNPTDEELEKYKLNNSKYYIEFYYHDADSDTADGEAYVYNTISISEKNADGNYYAYSENFDMIVLIDAGYLDFLEWDDSKWFDEQYVQLDISYITDIIIESGKLNTSIKFDNSGSKIATYLHGSGNIFTDAKKNQYTIKQNNGKYWLFLDGKALEATFSGDYLLSSLPYSAGVPENENFIIMESVQSDSDGDGESDSIIHYGYNVIYKNGYYSLAASVALTDLQGNQIGNTSQINGEVAYASEYFVTSGSRMFFASKSSLLGTIITERYAQNGLGSWHNGEVYVTADEKYVLIDKNTGEWSIIEEFTCGVHIGDRNDSALSKHAVRVEAQYNSTGKLIAPEEYYYSTGSHKIRYNYDTQAVEKYNMNKRTWEAAALSDYTTGIWLCGSYFVTESKEIVLIDESSGDWGVIAPTKSNSEAAQIYVDGSHLSYEIDTTTQAGANIVRDEIYNFRQFYKGLLYASLEGMADLTDEQMQAFRDTDNFSGNDPSNPCLLKLTAKGRDMYGNERNIVYRFYKYTERRAYITIEVLGESGESSSQNGYGAFYVLSSFAEKIISDAEKLLNGEEISATSKY